MKILRHRNTRTGFFLHYENDLLLKVLMKLRISTYLQAPGSFDPAHLLLTPPPGPPAASSLVLGHHGGPGAGGGEHLS